MKMLFTFLIIIIVLLINETTGVLRSVYVLSKQNRNCELYLINKTPIEFSRFLVSSVALIIGFDVFYVFRNEKFPIKNFYSASTPYSIDPLFSNGKYFEKISPVLKELAKKTTL